MIHKQTDGTKGLVAKSSVVGGGTVTSQSGMVEARPRRSDKLLSMEYTDQNIIFLCRTTLGTSSFIDESR